MIPTLADFGADRELTPRELDLMRRELGSWTETEIRNETWRTESLYMLHWSLGVVADLPPWDDMVTSPDFDIFDEEAVAKLRLRGKDEIDSARELAELWLWRARTNDLELAFRFQGKPSVKSSPLPPGPDMPDSAVLLP